MGKYSSITSVVIQFSQTDLHRLASGNIDASTLFQTSNSNTLARDPISILQQATTKLLADACARTGNLTGLPMLVDKMTYSWLATNGTLCNIRATDHIKRALDHSLSQNLTKLVIQCNTDLLYFDHIFTGVNLDHVDTSPFPAPSGVAMPPSNTAAPPAASGTSHLPVVPATSIFNYHALPLDVLNWYDNFQTPATIVPVQDLMPFVDTLGVQTNFYANPFIISTRIILQNGSVLEGVRDEKRFSLDPPVYTNATTFKLRTWYRNLTNHTLSCGYFVVPYELLSKTHGGSTGFEFGIDLLKSKLTENSA
jgi:hypothetical protein